MVNLTATEVMRGDTDKCLQNWSGHQLAHHVACHVSDSTVLLSEKELKSFDRADLVSRAFMWHYTHGIEQDLTWNSMAVRHEIEANHEYT